MYETTTVDEAIKKGHRTINYPSFIILVCMTILGFYFGTTKKLPMWSIPIGFILGIILAWIYWSFMVTKWKLWAFENVRNVHELKKRAIQENLIWKDDSIFRKTEIATPSEKEKWRLLSSKFNKEDIFQDDLTIESETIIYVSKKNLIFNAAILVFCAFIGIYLVFADKLILGGIMTIVSIFMAYSDFKKARNVEPQIILNSKGIKTVNSAFQEWDNISEEEVIISGYGKNIHHYLVYNYPNGAEKLDIKYLDTDLGKLNKLLILYRGRSKKRK
jgi:hypothetical protein